MANTFIIALTFYVLSLLILIVLGIVMSRTNKRTYIEKVRYELDKLGYTLLSLESEEPFEINDDRNFFIHNYGSSIVSKVFKRVFFTKSDNIQASMGYVIIERFFFLIKSVKIYTSDKKTPLT